MQVTFFLSKLVPKNLIIVPPSYGPTYGSTSTISGGLKNWNVNSSSV